MKIDIQYVGSQIILLFINPIVGEAKILQGNHYRSGGQGSIFERKSSREIIHLSLGI